MWLETNNDTAPTRDEGAQIQPLRAQGAVLPRSSTRLACFSLSLRIRAILAHRLPLSAVSLALSSRGSSLSLSHAGERTMYCSLPCLLAPRAASSHPPRRQAHRLTGSQDHRQARRLTGSS